MNRSLMLRGAAACATVALLGGAAFVASGATGAYFSDTHTGTISGTIGSVQEATDGGIGTDKLDLSFTNLMPGVPQSVTANYSNQGTGNQDFYITFPNVTALSAFNNLGQYGTVHISSTGSGAVGDVFDSDNLYDNLSRCGTFGQGTTTVNNVVQPLCWPLPNQLLIASNIGHAGYGSVTITFNYASALGASANKGGGVFNTWPVSAHAYDPSAPNNNDQTYIDPLDGSGTGLPYDIVATQVGIAPGAPGTKP